MVSLGPKPALCSILVARPHGPLDPDGSPSGDDRLGGTRRRGDRRAHLFANRKVRNVQRDPRVTLSIEGTGLSDRGLKEYLVVHGHARIEDGGAAELLQRLAHVYLGPDVRFPPMDDPPAGFVMRTTPLRVGGVGPWAG